MLSTSGVGSLTLARRFFKPTTADYIIFLPTILYSLSYNYYIQ
jgi:hypothetical protein